MKLIRPDYENSILNVSNSLLKHYNITPFHQTHPVVDKVLQEKKYNHIIYILLDGMGHNIVQKLDSNNALKKYTKHAITSVFPPTTVAATNTVLSGKTPIETGYLGWVQYFEQVNSDVTVFLNKDFYTNKTYDHNIRNTYLKYKNILELAKVKNPELHINKLFPDFIEEGSITSFKDGIEKALLITHNTDTSFNYLYWIEPDLTEHKYGIYSEESTNVLKALNNDFEDLLKNITDDTLVICIADHGLTNVEEINLFNYESLMNKLRRKPSIEPRAINFFVKQEHIDSFKEEFTTLFKGKYQLLSKGDILASEIFGTGIKHSLIDMFIGDYIGIAVDKYMFSVNDKKTYKAHHAGLCEDEMMVPLIIYSK